jgi:hypothetical protein
MESKSLLLGSSSIDFICLRRILLTRCSKTTVKIVSKEMVLSVGSISCNQQQQEEEVSGLVGKGNMKTNLHKGIQKLLIGDNVITVIPFRD